LSNASVSGEKNQPFVAVFQNAWLIRCKTFKKHFWRHKILKRPSIYSEISSGIRNWNMLWNPFNTFTRAQIAWSSVSYSLLKLKKKIITFVVQLTRCVAVVLGGVCPRCHMSTWQLLGGICPGGCSPRITYCLKRHWTDLSSQNASTLRSQTIAVPSQSTGLSCSQFQQVLF